MKELCVKLMCDKHITIEEVESVILRDYPGCKILSCNESILPDVLEDEETGERMVIYVYYAHIRKEN